MAPLLATTLIATTLPAKTMLAFIGTPGPWQLIIVGMVILLLFGNRLPSVMRSLGEGITEFKKGIKGGETDPKVNLEDKSNDDRD